MASGSIRAASAQLELVGEDVQAFARGRDPLGIPAGTLDAEELAGPAEVGRSALARIALAAGDKGIDGYASAVGVGAGDLVSHHQGRLPPAGAADAVELTSADPDSLDLDHDLAGIGRRLVDVEHVHLVGGGEDQCAHVHLGGLSVEGVYSDYRRTVASFLSLNHRSVRNQ